MSTSGVDKGATSTSTSQFLRQRLLVSWEYLEPEDDRCMDDGSIDHILLGRGDHCGEACSVQSIGW